MKSLLIASLFIAAVPLAQAGRDGGVPLAALSVTALDFGIQVVHSTHILVVPLKNASQGWPLNVSSVKIQGSADFSQTNNCVGTLAPQTTCYVSVSFAPSGNVAESGTLTFTDNATNIPGSTQSVSLTGTGTLSPPSLVLSATALNFGPTAVDGGASTLSVTVRNQGQQPGIFTAILFAGPNGPDFHSIPGPGTCQTMGSLAGGASCAMQVSFAPTGSAGVSRNSTLMISDNNNGGTGVTQSIALSGTAQFGVPLAAVVNPVSRTLANAASQFSINVSGANLTAASVVSLNGTKLSTVKGGSSLQATVPAGLITSAGSPSITVTNPGAAISNSVLFPVPAAATSQPQFVSSTGNPLVAPGTNFTIATGDFNHDGKQDVIVCSYPYILIYLSNGDGTYTMSQAISPQPVAFFNWWQPSQPTVVEALPFAAAVGDLNGDGIADLAIMSYPNSVVIYRGVGDGTFAPQTMDTSVWLPRAYQVGDSPSFGVIGDFNRDGKLDIAASSGDGTIAILQGNGDGTFALGSIIYGGTGAGALVAGDFNSDGMLDLAAVSTGSNSVRILLGNGSGGFNSGPTLPTGSAPKSIATGDFNGDGFPDLAIANSGSGFVTILLGSSSGTFTPMNQVFGPAAPASVAIGDLNGDGKVDLVVANGTDGTFSVLLGLGNGTFSPAYAPVKMGTNIAAAYVVDANSDGRLDLILIDASSNKVTTLLSK